jgi:SNF2 family DNA or RNA helicase
MAISPTAIQKFLERTAKPPCIVKGRDIDDLVRMIERDAGADYKPKTIPRPYQLEALAFACRARRSLMFLKMRLGKTKLALDYAEVMRRGKRWQLKGLVVVPSPVTLSVWEEEIPKHSNLRGTFIHSTDPMELQDACELNDNELVVIPWSSLQYMFTVQRPATDRRSKKAHMVDYKTARSFASYFDFACIDEIHMCKNESTLRFKIASTLTEQCDLFMGLTGTPHGRNPFDVWAQAFLCDRGETLGNSYHFFTHAMGKTYNVPWRYAQEVRFNKKLTDVFTRKVNSISVSYGWEGNLELPELTKNVVRLPMTKEQQAQYRDILQEITNARREERQRIENAFVRLRQVSSGFRPFKDGDGEMQVLELDNSAKLEWIEEFIENAPEEAPIVLFHEFTATGERLCRLLTKHKRKHAWLYGGTKDRAGTLQSFRTGKVNTLVCNTASGGIGVDLSRADYMAFVECPTSPTVRQQAEARPLGKKGGHIFVDDLICSPVEARVLNNVMEGKTLLANIIYQEAKSGLFNL